MTLRPAKSVQSGLLLLAVSRLARSTGMGIALGMAMGVAEPAMASGASETGRPDWVLPARTKAQKQVATAPTARPDWVIRPSAKQAPATRSSRPGAGTPRARQTASPQSAMRSPRAAASTAQLNSQQSQSGMQTIAFRSPPSRPPRVLTPDEAAAARRTTAVAAGLDVPARAPTLPATLPREAAPVLPNEPRPFRLNPTDQTVRLPLPLVSGTRELGSVTVEVAPNDAIAINRIELVAAVSQALTPAGVAELERGIGANSSVTVASLNAAGYATALELATMTLKIALPPRGQWPVDLAVSPRRIRYSGEVVAPANVSAYVNLRGNLDYIWSEDGNEVIAPDIFMDAAGRVGPLAWEAEATLRTDSDEAGLTRQGTRLIYDHLKSGTRIVVGDQSNATRSFLGSTPAAAISLSNSSNQFTPDEQTRNPGEQTVTVLRPSTIEAIVNNRSVRTFRVEPGVYRFSDFPFAQGANDLRLEITDDSGGREVVSSSLFVERALFERGQKEYNLTAGVEAGVDTNGLSYNGDRPFVSGFYTAGISDQLTLGASAQATSEGVLGGVEGRLSVASGIVSMDAAVSSRNDAGQGVAVNIAYSRRSNADAVNPIGLGVSAQYVGDGFSSVFGEAGTSPIEWQFGATLSRSLSKTTSLNANFRHAIGRNSVDTSSSALVSVTQRFGAAGALSLEADYSKDSQTDSWGLRLGYVHRLGERSSARLDYASSNDQIGLAWLNSAGQGVGATTTNVDLRYNKETVSGVAAIGRVGNWIDGGVSHSLAYASAQSQLQDQRTSARFATALAYADGAFGVSRPISNGFAIFVSDRTLKGAAVEIEPRDEGYEARSFAGLPPVANNIAAYSLRQVTYGVPDAPLGYDIGSGSVAMRAPYRGGYVIRVGSSYNQSAVGQLVFRDGSPAALLSGYAHEASSDGASQDGREPIQLFTNAAGRFGIAGLRPGTWIIDLQSDIPVQFVLTIPADAQGIYDAGTVRETGSAARQEASR